MIYGLALWSDLIKTILEYVCRRVESQDKGEINMPKNTKTEKKEKVVIEINDAYFNARIVPNHEEIVQGIEDERIKSQVQYALDDVVGDYQPKVKDSNGNDTDETDQKARLKCYAHLAHLNSTHDLGLIIRLRGINASPNKQAYHNMVDEKVQNLLDNYTDSAMYAGFAAVRRTQKNPNALLTLDTLKDYLAGRFETATPYAKNTDYTTLTPSNDEETVPEVVEE